MPLNNFSEQFTITGRPDFSQVFKYLKQRLPAAGKGEFWQTQLLTAASELMAVMLDVSQIERLNVSSMPGPQLSISLSWLPSTEITADSKASLKALQKLVNLVKIDTEVALVKYL